MAVDPAAVAAALADKSVNSLEALEAEAHKRKRDAERAERRLLEERSRRGMGADPWAQARVSALQRVRVTDAPVPFVPHPERRSRITFAQVEHGEPVAYRAGAGVRVVVVVWPTDARAMLDAAAVRAGAARVTTWDMSPAHVAELRALVVGGWNEWHVHDMYVGGTHDQRHGRRKPAGLGPAFRTFRDTVYWPRITQDQIEHLIREA
jgi:hypothetical protein